tara:strand:+ start:2325 stop:2636 length:312 start_codon:yes stop_codon:yes gene_type:complete
MTMKNILFLVFAFSLFAAGFVSAAHAHAGEQGSNQQIELSADQDNTDNSNVVDPLCDMHCHNHLAPTDFTQAGFQKNAGKLLISFSESPVSSLIYGLKRPPKV